MSKRINVLIKLEEEINKTKENILKHQTIVKKWFDSHKSTEREFQVGDLVLKWDKQHEDDGRCGSIPYQWFDSQNVF